MRGRIGTLICPALAVLLVLPGMASAHRLVIGCSVLPDHRIQVEAWYNSAINPHPAGQAKVDVFRADGTLFITGQLDAQGLYAFRYESAEPLKVVVSQTGHREEMVLQGDMLAPAEQPATSKSDGVLKPLSRVSSENDPRREAIKEGFIGVGFILALAAFVLSIRTARSLKALRRGERDV